MIGIYKITNIVNGKCYIGQSVNIKQRWKGHKKDAFWVNGDNYNYPLYRAIRKYGVENFSFEVLESCSIDELEQKEIEYINFYSSIVPKGYNQVPGGNHVSVPLKLTAKEAEEIRHRLKTTNQTNQQIANDFNVTEATIRSISYGLTWVSDSENYPLRPIRERGKAQTPPVKKTIIQSTSQSQIFHQKEKASVPHKTKKEIGEACPICGNQKLKESQYCIACANKLRNMDKRTVARPDPLELAHKLITTSFKSVAREYKVSDNAIRKWCKTYKIPCKKELLKQWYAEQTNNTYIPPIPRKKNPVVVKKVKQIDIATGEILQIFDSAKHAAEHIQKHDSHIFNVCTGKRKTAYGYRWEYL